MSAFSLWVPVVAALGASLFTGLASLGVAWVQAAWRTSEDRRQHLETACSDVLSASMLVADRIRVLNATLQVRSGVAESLDVTLRHRKPVDPLELHDWLGQDMTALHKAVSEVWLRGEPSVGNLASDIELQCAVLLELATSVPGQRTFLQNLKRIERDEAFIAKWLEGTARLGTLRRTFLQVAQRSLGGAVASSRHLGVGPGIGAVTSNASDVDPPAI